MPSPEDLVLGRGVAVRDFGGGHFGGGDRAPLLLLHGAGANLVSMQQLAGELSPRFRVITVDLPGHGHTEHGHTGHGHTGHGHTGHDDSADGPWDWETALGDLEAVREELGLPEPAVAGWSLGGMLAALWAERHPLCPAAVSLDGTPPPSRADQCAGIDPVQARNDLERLNAVFSAMRDSMAAPLTPSGVDAALGQQRAMASRYGIAEDVAAEGFRRNLTIRDGQTWARPLPHALATLQEAMGGLDIMPVYRQVKCPLLVALATDDLPEQQPFRELYAAYRRGFEGRLAEVADANPCLRVVRVEGASHALVAERPAEIARMIADFVTTSAA
ncbi:MAG: alpha/beta fold hydrolase [Trebonia sp.]